MDFAIIGEAAKQVPVEVKRKYPQVPWRQMAGIRDKMSWGGFFGLLQFWGSFLLFLFVG